MTPYHDDAVQGQNLPPSGGNKLCDVCKVVIVVAVLLTLLFVLAAVLGPVAVTLCLLARFISTPTCSLEWKEMKAVDHTAGKLLTMQQREQLQRQQLEKLESTLSANESLSPRAVAALFYMDDMESCECASVMVIVIEPVTLVCTSGTKASDCNHDETAKVGGAILSFVLFMMQSYNAEAVSSVHALPLALQSFDHRIHFQECLRLLFVVIVCQVRYGKLFKESSASVLA